MPLQNLRPGSKGSFGLLDLFGRAGNHVLGLARRPVCPPCEAKQRELLFLDTMPLAGSDEQRAPFRIQFGYGS